MIDDSKITIKRTLPKIDECKYLITKVIDRAIRDFITFENWNSPIEKEIYEGAVDFIFDDNYFTKWGNKEYGFRDFCDILGMDYIWVRENILVRKIEQDPIMEVIEEAIDVVG